MEIDGEKKIKTNSAYLVKIKKTTEDIIKHIGGDELISYLMEQDIRHIKIIDKKSDSQNHPPPLQPFSANAYLIT